MVKGNIFKLSIEDDMVADDGFEGSLDQSDPEEADLKTLKEYDTTEMIEYQDDNDSMFSDIQEIESCVQVVEDNEEITADMDGRLQVQQEQLALSPDNITDVDAMIAQEQYAYFIGLLRLDYSKVETARLSMESASTPVEKYKVSTEALKEAFSSIMDAISAVVSKVIDMIRKMRAKVLVWFGNFSKQATSMLNKLQGTDVSAMITKDTLPKLDQGDRDKIKSSLGIYCACFNGEQTEAKSLLNFSYSTSTIGYMRSILECNKVWQDIITGKVKDKKEAYQKGFFARLFTFVGLQSKKLDDISSGDIPLTYVVGGADANHSVPVEKVMPKLQENMLKGLTKKEENAAEIYFVAGFTDKQVVNIVMETKKGKSEIGIPNIVFRTEKVDIKADMLEKSDEMAVAAFSGQNKEQLRLLLTGVADKSKGIEGYYKQLDSVVSDALAVINDIKKLVMTKEKESGFWEKVGIRTQLNSYFRSVRSVATTGMIASLKQYINFSKKAIQFAGIVMKDKSAESENKSAGVEEEKKK